ncbi:MAG: PAS domain S-box protein [Euryarchaeota archaeon]|nr:PAS domain S-box protein [Euryarchaeota archaeon]
MAEKKRMNVLLIEDSPTDTQLIQGLLHDTQHERITLITASTLSKGLDELSQDAFDIILLDLGLPDSQGLETFRAIRAQAPHLAVIVLTIADDEELGRRAVQEGAQRFLSKDALKLGGLQSSMVTSALSDAIAHKQAKSALKASKEDFKALFELSPIAKIRYDADGYPTELNNAALALVGVTEVGAIRHISLFSTPRISEAEKERLRNGEAIRYEQQYDFDEIKKAGHFPTSSSGVSYLDAHVSPLFTEAGVVEAYIGEFVDITERKHAEVELASIAKFPEENPSPVLRLAHDGTVLYRNAPGEFFLNNVLFPFDEVRQQAAQAYAAAKVLTFEVTDESHVYKLTLVPIANEHYINVYATDITERSRAEQALVEERDLAQRYLNLINLAHDAIIIRDLDHHALAWNKGAERLFGWTAAEAVGKRVPDLIKAVFPLSFERFQKKLLKEGHWEGTVRCEARDETPLIVEHRFTVEYDDSGAPAQLLSISYDITGHRQADEALLQAHGEMQKLNEELRIANEVLEQRVQERTEKLTRELAVTETITRLTPPLLFPLLDLDGLMLAILEDAKRLTGSAHGFIALIDPHTKELIAYGHTLMMLKECAIPDALRQVRFPVGPNGHYYGLWGHALNQREGFFTNAPAEHPAAAGTPQGHTLLEQVLVVPALITDEVVGEITLANPGRDYTKEDLVVVARLAEELFSLAVMRIRTEEQLNEASFYARNLIEASPDPLVTISAKGTITDANKATEGVTGHSRDELIGSDFSNYFTEPELARRGYQQVFANGFVKDYPLAIQHKSGSITEVLYNATVYRDEAGKVQGVFAAARDITELKRAQRELERYSGHLEALVDERTSRLAQSEEDFRALFETSAVPDPVRYRWSPDPHE